MRPQSSLRLFAAGLAGLAALPPALAASTALVDYRVTVDEVSKGYDGKTCWIGARAGTIPGRNPIVVLTMQKLFVGHSDVFFAISDRRTTDLGRIWTPPVEHATLSRRTESDGSIINIAGLTPQWHARSGKLLGTGVSSHYTDELKDEDPPARPAYSVYDADRQSWSPWAMVSDMPDATRYYYISAGNGQRVDLPNGDILLPVSFKAKGPNKYHTTVVRCTFDGVKMRYVEHGTELGMPEVMGRPVTTDPYRTQIFDMRQAGLFEPSLTRFKGEYFLTMRNRQGGYVARSKNGLHFAGPFQWTFDDGKPIDIENTQTHWVTHSDGLFLTYTRRGANNDHVFRHRAPIFIAQVDVAKLCVIRASERVLIPGRGVDIGSSFSVTNVSERETWVTTAEVMQPRSDLHKYGADNYVYVARITWNKPNTFATATD